MARLHLGSLALLCSAVAIITMAGCDRPGTGNSLGDAPPAATAPTQTPSTVGEEGTLVTEATDVGGSLSVMSAGGPGDYVVDSNHRAVYLLKGDVDGSGCTGGCLERWAPVVPPSGDPTVAGDGLAPVLIGSIDRADGSRQVTYNGHPLYHFAGDNTVGSTAGHGMGGKWYLVSPQGNALGEEVGELETPPSAGSGTH